MLLLQQSGWQDSNLRPPGPKPGALAKLSHTPLFFFIYLCFVVRRKTYYMVSHPKCQHFFSIFFVFFWKSDFFGFKKCRKAAKIKALQAFHFFEKSFIFLLKKWFVGMVFKIFCKKIFFSHNKKISIFYYSFYFRVTVHSVHSNLAKIHSRLPAAMEFWLVCLGILAYSCQNTSRDTTCEQ